MPDENGNAPVTKGDLAVVRAELRSEIGAVRSELRSEIAALREEVHADLILVQEKVTEAIQDAETRILTGFYKYAEAAQKRLALLEGTDANILSRLGSMESRILEIEKRLNIPPGETA